MLVLAQGFSLPVMDRRAFCAYYQRMPPSSAFALDIRFHAPRSAFSFHSELRFF